ncbi:hypothetical protein YC2023_089274 [Brassica napus]
MCEIACVMDVLKGDARKVRSEIGDVSPTWQSLTFRLADWIDKIYLVKAIVERTCVKITLQNNVQEIEPHIATRIKTDFSTNMLYGSDGASRKNVADLKSRVSFQSIPAIIAMVSVAEHRRLRRENVMEQPESSVFHDLKM